MLSIAPIISTVLAKSVCDAIKQNESEVGNDPHGPGGGVVLKYISYTGMCRPNRSFFHHEKSVERVHFSEKKPLDMGLFSIMFKIVGLRHLKSIRTREKFENMPIFQEKSLGTFFFLQK